MRWPPWDTAHPADDKGKRHMATSKKGASKAARRSVEAERKLREKNNERIVQNQKERAQAAARNGATWDDVQVLTPSRNTSGTTSAQKQTQAQRQYANRYVEEYWNRIHSAMTDSQRRALASHTYLNTDKDALWQQADTQKNSTD